MAVLFNNPSDDPRRWRDALLALDPALDLRIWPDTGRLEEIEFVLAWLPEPGDLRRYPNLKAVFWLGAGVDGILADEALPPDLPIVRLADRGLTVSMTEYVLLHVLRYHRRVPELEAQQRARQWRPLDYPLPWKRRVGIMGLGALGGDAAAKLVMLGFDTAGWSRSRKRLEGVACFAGQSELAPFLARSEILVCLLPLTPATAGILDARCFAALPRGAFLVNAARGGHLVAEDLLAALDSGQIAHATLDVFTPEPLPPEHPFWTHPRITVTPHTASLTHAETAAPVLIEGMRAIREGRPVANLVDRRRGY